MADSGSRNLVGKIPDHFAFRLRASLTAEAWKGRESRSGARLSSELDCGGLLEEDGGRRHPHDGGLVSFSVVTTANLLKLV
jgi:hypothetical protein